jgi:hypothetical protein
LILGIRYQPTGDRAKPGGRVGVCVSLLAGRSALLVRRPLGPFNPDVGIEAGRAGCSGVSERPIAYRGAA